MSYNKNGIDVSHWQGTIDWKKVKKDGVEFAMIRAAAGTKLDTKFIKNIEEALSLEIPCGVYLYSLARTKEDAKTEAEFLLERIKPYKIQYPVAYDLEDSAQFDMSKADRTELIETFLSIIQKEQYHTTIYSSLSWFNTMFDLKRLKAFDKWVAQWDVKECGFMEPFQIWQHTNKGKVSGIDGYVDQNISFFNYPSTKLGNENPVVLEPGKQKKDKGIWRAGMKITLFQTPLYLSSTSKNPVGRFSRDYWIYDGINQNSRLRLTNGPDKVGKKPMETNVTAYVAIQDLYVLLK